MASRGPVAVLAERPPPGERPTVLGEGPSGVGGMERPSPPLPTLPTPAAAPRGFPEVGIARPRSSPCREASPRGATDCAWRGAVWCWRHGTPGHPPFPPPVALCPTLPAGVSATDGRGPTQHQTHNQPTSHRQRTDQPTNQPTHQRTTQPGPTTTSQPATNSEQTSQPTNQPTSQPHANKPSPFRPGANCSTLSGARALRCTVP